MNPKGIHSGALRRCAMLAVVGLAGLAQPMIAQNSLVADSPFAVSGSASAAASGPAKDYELAGSSTSGSDISVCIFERQAKRSEWIPVGGSSNGIKVISFDQVHDKAVVIVSGQRREISMRTATVASLPQSAPARTAAVENVPTAPLVPVGQAPAVTGTPEQQQREARMLVSDLLEIGVQQRKAYQDAKAKAAQAGTPAPGN